MTWIFIQNQKYGGCGTCKAMGWQLKWREYGGWWWYHVGKGIGQESWCWHGWKSRDSTCHVVDNSILTKNEKEIWSANGDCLKFVVWRNLLGEILVDCKYLFWRNFHPTIGCEDHILLNLLCNGCEESSMFLYFVWKKVLSVSLLWLQMLYLTWCWNWHKLVWDGRIKPIHVLITIT